MPEYTEIRPGTYIYNDMNMVRGGYCALDDCAARIICTVVSTAVPGQVVIDAGTKTLTSDRYGPRPTAGHGYIVEYPEAVITRAHRGARAGRHPRLHASPQLGERVTVIPNHICPCVNLQDVVWWRDEQGQLVELPIDARGLLS